MSFGPRSISVPFGSNISLSMKMTSVLRHSERTRSSTDAATRRSVHETETNIFDPFYYFLLLLRPWLKRGIDRLLQVRRRQQVFYAGLLTETTSASPAWQSPCIFLYITIVLSQVRTSFPEAQHNLGPASKIVKEDVLSRFRL